MICCGIKKTILLAFILILPIICVKSQVTIGSGIPPSNGVLLDLKENNDENGGKTTGKGLLFPRVTLTTSTALVDIQGADISKPKLYTGLTVYNVSTTGPGEGMTTWDGTKWVNIQTLPQFFDPKTFIRARGGTTVALATVALFDNWKKIHLTVEDFDENSEYDTSTYEFKPKQKGIYDIYAQYKINGALQVGDFGVGILLKKNGETDFTLIAEQTVSVVNILNTNPPTRVVQTLLKLDVGDIVVVAARSALNITLLGDRNTFFTVAQVK